MFNFNLHDESQLLIVIARKGLYLFFLGVKIGFHSIDLADIFLYTKIFSLWVRRWEPYLLRICVEFVLINILHKNFGTLKFSAFGFIAGNLKFAFEVYWALHKTGET